MAFAKTEHFEKEDVLLAAQLKAFSHAARLVILRYLVQHKGCICNDIVGKVPLSQPTISQHLKILREAGLIKGEYEGNAICYCLDREVLAECYRKFENLFRNLEIKTT